MTWLCLFLQLHFSPSISLMYFTQTTHIALLPEHSLCEYQSIELCGTRCIQHAATQLWGIDTCFLFLVLFSLISEWPDFSAQISLNNNENEDDDGDESWLPTVCASAFSTPLFPALCLGRITSTDCPTYTPLFLNSG